MIDPHARLRFWAAPVCTALLVSCAHGETATPAISATSATAETPAAAPPTAEQAKAFTDKVNVELKDLWVRSSTAEWIKSTYITDDTEQNAAWANEKVMAYLTDAIKQAATFKKAEGLDPQTVRFLYLLSIATTLPAPSNPAERRELAEVAAKLEGLYGKGKYCGKDGQGKCRDLQELSRVLAQSRNYDELLDAWEGWHAISRPMRPLYERLVTLSNAGAQELGYPDTGVLWRSGYDMAPEDFEKQTDRLWEQVKPLYEDLHCYVRGRLQQKYGKDKVPDGKPIPAHLLGNMWAQEWNNIYPLVVPYPRASPVDLDAAMKAQHYDWKKMVGLGENFFVSLGMQKLPETFWQRSMFVKPRDREVVCHASAWDVTFDADVRLKMCIEPRVEDLITIHHELGHIYYYLNYYQRPVLFQSGANDGFHEAIGDALTLSITPAYLKQLGLLKELPKDRQGLINVQMRDALEKVAFLPFGKLIDQWRWDVFNGKVPPSAYNAAWWKLREQYQGVGAPLPRTEQDFDPGSKYHIPANVPYARYFLARILQFQFHRGMCRIAGFKGPLYECSIYGNKAAGEKLAQMLKLGASQPWPEALATLTGERELDASALLEYFQPLQQWLKEQNQGQKCGW